MKYFETDFKKLSALLLPTVLRKPKMIDWLQVLLAPLISLNAKFLVFRNQDLYKVRHNGQVCYLRKVLNDAFDNDLRRIQITDGNRYKPTYIYTEAEIKPKYLGELYLYDESVFEDTGADFLVLLPFEIWNTHKKEIEIGNYKFYEIEALVNYYKLSSMRYKIELM